MNCKAFSVHWLNNKELLYGVGGEKIIAEILLNEQPNHPNTGKCSPSETAPLRSFFWDKKGSWKENFLLLHFSYGSYYSKFREFFFQKGFSETPSVTTEEDGGDSVNGTSVKPSTPAVSLSNGTFRSSVEALSTV